jgi:hypothetical protein
VLLRTVVLVVVVLIEVGVPCIQVVVVLIVLETVAVRRLVRRRCAQLLGQA